MNPSGGLTVDSSARDQLRALHQSDISARELLDLHLERIAARNPELNAVVSIEVFGLTRNPVDPSRSAGGCSGGAACALAAGLRIAVSVDLGGAFAVDAEVAAAVEESARLFTTVGARVTGDHPVLDEADEVFRTLRARHLQAKFGAMLAENPEAFKPSLEANIRAGEHLSGADVARAYRLRTQLSERMRLFFDDHDLLVLPAAQVPPFPADQEYPSHINGRPVGDYLAWLRAAHYITATGCPVISLPFARTADGLPVGLQIVAAHGRDAFLLAAAAMIERMAGDRPAGDLGPWERLEAGAHGPPGTPSSPGDARAVADEGGT